MIRGDLKRYEKTLAEASRLKAKVFWDGGWMRIGRRCLYGARTGKPAVFYTELSEPVLRSILQRCVVPTPFGAVRGRVGMP